LVKNAALLGIAKGFQTVGSKCRKVISKDDSSLRKLKGSNQKSTMGVLQLR